MDGVIKWRGEDIDDHGKIIAKEGVITFNKLDW